MAEDGDEDSTAQRVNAPIQQEPSPLPQGRLLLEEEKGRQKHKRGPHEAQSPGTGGQYCRVAMEMQWSLACCSIILKGSPKTRGLLFHTFLSCNNLKSPGNTVYLGGFRES